MDAQLKTLLRENKEPACGNTTPGEKNKLLLFGKSGE